MWRECVLGGSKWPGWRGTYLPSSSFNHKVTREVRRRCVFERSQDDRFIKWVTWNDAPVVKYSQREGSTLILMSTDGVLLSVCGGSIRT